mgnify:CR=1 FL=1
MDRGADVGPLAADVVADLVVGPAEGHELLEVLLQELVATRRRAPASEELRVIVRRVPTDMDLASLGEPFRLRIERVLKLLHLACHTQERSAVVDDFARAIFVERQGDHLVVLEPLHVVLRAEA